MAMAVLNHGMREVVPPGVDAEFSSLLQRCWHTDPGRRPSFLEVSYQAPFVAGDVWVTL